jgi:outer membrane protein assembly factor BamB
MAMPRRIKIDFGDVFPYGVYAVGEVQAQRDFDKSTRDKPVQAIDDETGLPVWSIDVIDADPEATKSTRAITVKVAAKVQPVLPEASSGPFTQVEFDGLTATAYVADAPGSGGRGRLAWSFRASEVRAPRRSSTTSPKSQSSAA